MARKYKDKWSGDPIWKLPTATKKGKWRPVARIGRTVPWGYEQDPNDPDILLPIPEQLDKLEEGRGFMRQGYSLRQVAEWLTEETGRYISHVGLKKRGEIEDKRKRSFQQSHIYRRQLERILEKLDKLENESFGVDNETVERYTDNGNKQT